MFFLDWIKRKLKKKSSPVQSIGFNPRPGCLKAIEDKSCHPDTYACRHKCKDAYKCFKEHGQIARVVRGRVEGLQDDHIWMELEDEAGALYWYDPTWYNYDPIKYGCRKISCWTDRKRVKDEIHGVIKPEV